MKNSFYGSNYLILANWRPRLQPTQTYGQSGPEYSYIEPQLIIIIEKNI